MDGVDEQKNVGYGSWFLLLVTLLKIETGNHQFKAGNIPLIDG